MSVPQTAAPTLEQEQLTQILALLQQQHASGAHRDTRRQTRTKALEILRISFLLIAIAVVVGAWLLLPGEVFLANLRYVLALPAIMLLSMSASNKLALSK